MALVVPNNGEGDALEYFVNKTAPQNLILRLFGSNTTPAETDVAATYTEYAATGYSAITLTGASWGAPSEGAPTSIAYAQQTFTMTGAGDAYGYYMTRSVSGRIALAERFTGAPFSIPSGGGTIKVTPQITAD
jgi:hypothetical protein